MAKFLSCINVILVIATSLFAQNNTSIALLPLQGNNVSDTDANILTDELRSALVQSQAYNVLERSNMEAILGEQGFVQSGCTSDECAIEAGKILGVSKMVTGSVNKLGELYNINIRMFDVSTSQIEKSISQKHQGSIENLIDIIRDLGFKLSDTTPPDSEYGTQSGLYNRADKKFGLKAGFNFPKTTNQSNGEKGIIGGGMYALRLSKELFLQTELLYSEKEIEYYADDDIMVFDYLQLLVLISYNLAYFDDYNLGLSFNAGPALNFVLSAEENYEDATEDIKKQLNSTEFAFVFGPALDIVLGKVTISIDVRYELGITDIFKDDASWEVGKNRTFYIMAGISI